MTKASDLYVFAQFCFEIFEELLAGFWMLAVINKSRCRLSLCRQLASISLGLGTEVSNENFQILAADHVEGGINLGSEDGRCALESLMDNIDLVILDNLSTLFSIRSKSSSEAWAPIQEWLLTLRRRGLSVLFIHHAGTNRLRV